MKIMKNAVFWDVEERRFTQDLHGATFEKTAFFIVTAVKTSGLMLPPHIAERTRLRFDHE
jgi:hypothetical protein